MRRAIKPALIALLIIITGVLVRGSVPVPSIGNWLSAGSMTEARSAAASALLQDGRILITGGDNGSGPLASAEFFDTTGAFVTAPPMSMARSAHSATVLADGRVLVAGGSTGAAATNAAEIFDPAANAWTTVAGGMIQARSNHTASLLADGRVLFAGGDNAGTAVAALEIFDPVSGAFSSVGTMSSPRMSFASAVLSDGRVLFIGGSNGSVPLASTEIFDPASNSVAAGPALSAPRMAHSATTLLDGRVLVVGGTTVVTNADGSTTSTDLASAEIYDPATGNFAVSNSSLAAPRRDHAAFLLPNNNSVLIVGGTSAGADVATAEMFVPSAGTFAATGSPTAARQHATGSALSQDGILFLAGGANAAGTLATAELYGFATVKTDASDYAPGSIVTITGSGWQPGETVTLTLVESPLVDTHPVMTAVADSTGKIFNIQFSPDVHDISIRFYLTAVGSTSGIQAQNTFTDAAGDSTTVLVSCTPNTVLDNLAVTCTTEVDDTQSGTTNGWPQGTATFQVTSGTGTFIPVSGTCNLIQIGSMVNSNCSLSFTPTSTGTVKIKSNYNSSDNNNWKNGTSNQFSITVNPSATLTVTKTLNPGADTGLFNLRIDGSTVGTGANVGNGGTTGPIVVSVGTHTVGETAGTGTSLANYTATIGSPCAANGSITLIAGDNKTCNIANTLNTVATTLVMNSVSPNAEPFGSPGPVTFAAKLTRNDTGAGVVGATVNFTVDGGAAGSAVTDASGVASFTTYNPSALSVAMHNVGASFSAGTIGGTQFGTSTSGTLPLTVGKATPTITWTNPADITYGTALSTAQLNATASVPGTFAYTPAAGTVLNAGSGQSLHVDFTPSDTTNYAMASKDVTINVNRKDATWTTNPSSKTYGDAEPNPLTTGTGSGFLAADGVTATYSRAAGETVLGGPYHITATLGPSAAVLSNYNITNAGASFTINTRMAAVTPNVASKTYGDVDPAFAGTLTNFVPADNVIATYTRTAGETVAGSPYTISATLSPAGVLANYNVTYNTASFTINKRNASATPNVASKTYGDLDPAFSGTLTNFVSVDNVMATYTRTAGETVAGSPYTISATLSPAGVLANYNVTYNTASFTINKRNASWTTSPNSKTYGDADPIPLTSGSGTNFVDPVTASYGRSGGENAAGSPYHITAALSAAAGVLDNYSITNNGADFTINKRTATVTPSIASKTYGDLDPVLSGTLTNFVAADNVMATYTRTAGETVAGSPYTISATLSPAGVLANYNVTYNTASFTINKRNATWTTNSNAKTYGDSDPSPLTTGSGTNFVDPVTASYSRSAGENFAGSPYHITAMLNAAAGVLDNYMVTNNGADFTINRRLATWTTVQASKTYGDSDPTPLTTGGGSNFLPADGVTATYSRASGDSVASSPYHITATLNAAAGVLDNYVVTNNGADFTINRRMATWTTISASKTYGDTDPVPLTTGSGTNFLPGDNVTAAYSRALGDTVLGGPYQITATLSPAAVLSNYIITNAGASFTISARPATWTTNPASKNYGDMDPSPLTSGSGSNFIALDGVTATYGRAAGETVQAGGYHITATLSPASVLSNYSITNNGATFTINADNTSLSTAGAMANYGDASVTLHATVLNTTNSAAISEGAVTFTVKQGATTIGTVMSGTVSGGAATASFPLGTAVDAGAYTITASFGPSPDFNQSSTTVVSAGSLVVNQDTTSVTPANANATYGAASVMLTGTVSNTTNAAPVNGGTVTFTVRDSLNNLVGSTNSVTVSASMASATFNLGAGVSAGSYAVSASYSGSTDFKSSTSAASAALTITKATTAVSVSSSLNPSTFNQPVTFTAAVSPQISGTPTGSVTFVDTTTNTNLGTGASIGAGKWTLTTSSVPVNANLITATYGGDSNFTGNNGAITQIVHYASGGICDGDAGRQILQPINADGSSVFNGKSTSPAKFRVCDGNGVSIGTPGVVASFRLVGIVAGLVADNVDEAVVSTNPDNAFRWDPTAQQWIFNINNKSLGQTNQTYYFQIMLNDGTSILFSYGLK